jgi:uncharacterized protein
MSSFLGAGWGFPVTLDDAGQIRFAAGGEAAVRQSIWMILSTAPGERVMRPDFGCDIHDQVFGINRAGTANAVAQSVRTALSLWEPRIDLLDVTAGPDPARPGLLLIEISYLIRSTNSRYNLVYPFYLE